MDNFLAQFDPQLIFWSGTILILAVSILVGILRRSASATDWLSAGRQQGSLILVASISSTMVGGALFVAIVSFGFENGVLGFYLAAAYLVGLLLLGLVTPRIRALLQESDSDTLFDFLRKRISVPFGRGFEWINALLLSMAIGGQILALREYLGLPPMSLTGPIGLYVAIGLVLGVTTIYVILGGLKKDIISDALQLVFLVPGIALLLMLISDVPVREVLGALDPKYWSVGSLGPVFLVFMLVLFVPMLLVRADLRQRIKAGTSDQAAQRAFFISAPIVAGAFVLFTFLGMLAKGFNVSGDEAILSTLITQRSAGDVGPVLAAIVALAFVGAVISSLDSLINIGGIAALRAIRPSLAKLRLKPTRGSWWVERCWA